jgi:hypothetical protein
MFRAGGEREARAAGGGEAVAQVAFGLARIQRREVEARGDALRELAQFAPGQHLAQLRLAEQHDLQQLLRVGLEVGEQAHLLQRFGRQVLRLVDDQHDPQPFRVGLQQVGVERVDQALVLAEAAAQRDVQLARDRLEQLHRVEQRVEDQRDARVRGQLLEQQPADRRLARADLAGELHEAAAAALADAEQQVRERVPVALAQEDEARIRGDGERRLAQAVVGQVDHRPGGYGLWPGRVRPGPRARGLARQVIATRQCAGVDSP